MYGRPDSAIFICPRLDLSLVIDIAPLMSQHTGQCLPSFHVPNSQMNSDSNIAKLLIDTHDVENVEASLFLVEGIGVGHDHCEDFGG